MDRIDAMRLFVRLAARESFSAAAKDLKIKQSTASKWIAELEAELGATLVERTTRALHLTEAGQRLLARATEILSAFDEMARELGAKQLTLRGRLRVSLPVAFGKLFVVPEIATFLRKYPQVDVELMLSDRYVSLVDEGFDLAVRVGLPVDSTARGRKLANGRRRLVASPAYLRKHGTPTTPRELNGHSCLPHGESGSPPPWRFTPKRGAAVQVSVRGRVAANSSESILQLARGGLGIALLADWLVRDEMAKGRLVALLEDYDTPPAPVYALTPPGRYPSATARALVDHLAAAWPDGALC